MKILLVILVIAAVIALIWSIGAFLPRTTRRRHRLHLHAPPQRLWEALTDPEAFPSWNPEVTSVQRLDTGGDRLAWRETHKNGMVTDVEITDAHPPHAMTWRLAEETGVVRSRWQIELRPHDGGTELTFIQRRDVPNPLARLLTHTLVGDDSYLKLFLGSLAGYFHESAHVK